VLLSLGKREWRAVVQGTWVNGVDMAGQTQGFGKHGRRVALAATELKHTGPRFDIPEVDQLDAVLGLDGFYLGTA
jgi:hypothetical protein